MNEFIGLRRGISALSPHRCEWAALGAETCAALQLVCGGAARAVQHVGSTSVAHIPAKPILDITVGAESLDDAEELIPALEAIGAKFRRRSETDNELLFVMEAQPEIVTHHIHVVPFESMEWRNYQYFRDYLNAHPDKAQEYGTLKTALARQFPRDRKAYTGGKADLIRSILRKAQVWFFLGKTVTATIDRPVGTAHPKHPDMIYPINYGYIAGEIAPDGEGLDVYVLGEDAPCAFVTGQIIAVVHRADDVEDKLVMLAQGACPARAITAAEIADAIAFQERYYQSRVEVLAVRY
ncbi:MAG: GrpB family protein [Oscillospiraceae bacterium]